MGELITRLFSTGSFMPHGHCYLWKPELVWLHLLSDSLIVLAYYSIPITLLYFVQKRKDLSFDWVFLLFGSFIVFCGTTHLLEIWRLWHPVYWLSGMLKALTAVISVLTAILLVRLIPQALALPSPAQLARINQELEEQIGERLKIEHQYRQLNTELETKVAQRTQELQDSMKQVQEAADRLSLAMDAAKLGSWDWDLASQKIIWSPHHEILFGYQPGTPERTYAEWARVVHPEDLAQVEEAIQRAMAEGSDFLANYRLVWDNGSTHWIESFGRFYFDGASEPIRMLGMVREITERESAKAALEASEARFRQAILYSPLPIILYADDGEVLLVNQTWSELTGYQLADIPTIAAWIERAYEGDAHHTVQSIVHQLIETEERTRQGEFSIRVRSGDTRIWDFSSTHLGRLPDGRRLLMSKAMDVTERKQFEQALQESEERFRGLLEATVQIIWDTKAEGEFVTEQPSWCAFTGQTYEEYQGWGWLNAVHPNDQAHTAKVWSSAVETREIYQVEHQLRRYDGEYRYMSVRAVPIQKTDGSIREWIGIHTDITERMQVEESLHLSEERLRLATEAADLGMWFWDLKTDELVWTTRCKTLFGFNPDQEINYEYFLNALHPEDRDRTHAAVTAAIQKRQEYAIEYRSVWPDGSVHWLLAKGRAYYNGQGEPIRMMGMCQEISNRKQAEADLQERSQELQKLNQLLLQRTTQINQRNQELDQFAHIVSHDLKAPLRSIVSLSEWIEEDLAEHDSLDVKNNLELLRSRVYRMNDLIEGLLTYARIGHQESPCETFALKGLLDEILDSLVIPAEFNILIPSELPTLTTNRLLLSQVLTNLIGNAIKHHHRPDGNIEVQVQLIEQSPDLVYEFVIMDDGPGIDSKNQSRIFAIFQTLVSKDKKDSTGIGLAIVKKIIEQMGGEIRLESQLGQGSAFYFTWSTAPKVS